MRKAEFNANNNVVIGNRAMENYEGGWDNVIIGSGAGQFSDTLYSAVFIGHDAGQNATVSNIVIGTFAGRELTQGGNTIIGLYAADTLTQGYGNTLIGHGVAGNLHTGPENTLIGDGSGRNLKSEARNTFIGQITGLNLESGFRNVYIGGQTGVSEDYMTLFSESNTLRIHNSPDVGANVSPLVYGKFDDRKLEVNGSFHVRDFARLTPRSDAPISPEEGTLYYDSDDKKVKVWNGSTWEHNNMYGIRFSECGMLFETNINGLLTCKSKFMILSK